MGVQLAGGEPVLIPYETRAEEMDALLDGLDGVLFSGGPEGRSAVSRHYMTGCASLMLFSSFCRRAHAMMENPNSVSSR